MRKTLLLTLVIAVLFTAIAVLPTAAQDILGLSLRATDELPAGTARGTADIISRPDGHFLVSLDMSPAAGALRLSDYPGATAFAVWVVDTGGATHNLGTLDEGLTLSDVSVDYPIARLYVTAEPDGAAAEPAGKALFAATLRNVPAAAASASPGATATAPATGTSRVAMPTASQPATVTKPTAGQPAKPTAGAADAPPQRMPTAGGELPDLIVVASIALALLLLGLRLRALRF